jgi:hypothetical protein
MLPPGRFSFVLTGLLAVLSGCGGGGGGGGTPPGDTVPPTIVQARIETPQPLDFTGGEVTLRAEISDPSGVAWVRAVVTRPDQATATIELVSVGGGWYEGTYHPAPNVRNDNRAEMYTVSVTARDEVGNELAVPAQVGEFSVPAPEAPEPPPHL